MVAVNTIINSNFFVNYKLYKHSIDAWNVAMLVMVTGSLFVIYGLFLPPFAFIHALIINPKEQYMPSTPALSGEIECPYCEEILKGEAIFCRNCKTEVPDEAKDAAKNNLQEVVLILAAPNDLEWVTAYHWNNGINYFQSGKVKNAVESYSKVLKLLPRSNKYRRYIVSILSHLRNNNR